MTNKQNKICEWLLSKPGYIKNSAEVVQSALFSSDIGVFTIKDIKEALKEARKSVKKPKKSAFRKKQESSYTTNIITNPNLDTKNVLVIGDTHAPFIKEGYLEHNIKLQKDYKCGTIVHIGDVIDNSYSSFHETNPDGHGAATELDMAIEVLQPWFKAFPNAKVCLGNHDLIINRKAFSAGLSKRWIRGLGEVLKAPNWDFDLEHIIHNVLYTHGTGTSGANAAYNKALHKRISTVQGHLHTEASVRYNTSKIDKIFGMQVGCGVDEDEYAFDYARPNSRKFIISSGVVLNGGKLPIVCPMEL